MLKTLIISHNCFSNKRNNGKTLESMFFSFPKESIAQLFFHFEDTIDHDFCNNYFRITEKDVLKSIFIGHQRIGTSEFKKKSIVDSGHKRVSVFYKVKSLLGPVGRDVIWRIGAWYGKNLQLWLDGFNPNLIFYVGGDSSFSANIAIALSKRLHIPMVSYYTDDYLFSISQDSIKGRHHFKRTKKLYDKVFAHSSALYVIGDYMAKEYRMYFHRDFRPIMNSVVIHPYREYQNHQQITISYFGGLHLNRWMMIVRLASLLPHNAIIHVYSSTNSINEEIAEQFKSHGVIYCGSLQGDDLHKAMQTSDVLLHVESDNMETRRFTRLAVSTKIPEYLISGSPILGFGPKEVASMKILSDNEIGVVIGSDEKDEICANMISHFLNNYDLRKKYGQKGYEYASIHFDKNEISSKLKRELETIINSNKCK